MRVSLLFAFVAKVFLLLPLCYWGWYSAAELTTFLAVFLTEPLLQFLFPELINEIGQPGYLVEVIAQVTVPVQNRVQGMVAELPIVVNPLIYSYGLPLSLSLILASPLSPVRTVAAILSSMIAFLCIQIWGISFEALKILFLQTPSELLSSYSLSSWQLDIIALGYQLGALILPAVASIVIWIMFYQDYIVFITTGLLNQEDLSNNKNS